MIYDTGRDQWEYGKLYGTVYLLGPCPICGKPTFDYGGGWRCSDPWCSNSYTSPISTLGSHPDWWNTNIHIKLDGSQWCAHYDKFRNLQESPVGFGDTPWQAIVAFKADLMQHALCQ